MILPAKTYYVDFGVAFTAPADGLYQFATYDKSAGPGLALLVNGVDLSPCSGLVTGPNPEDNTSVFVAYLKAGDVITHTGSAGKLAGVRLGDELSE